MVRISKGKNGKRWIIEGNGKGGLEIFVPFIFIFKIFYLAEFVAAI